MEFLETISMIIVSTAMLTFYLLIGFGTIAVIFVILNIIVDVIKGINR